VEYVPGRIKKPEQPRAATASSGVALACPSAAASAMYTTRMRLAGVAIFDARWSKSPAWQTRV
jgi:hypothetical protein